MQFQFRDDGPSEELPTRGRKTHRGRRAMKAKDEPEGDADRMREANEHLKKAHADPTHKGTQSHLFRALKALGSPKKKSP